jgi:hypothetical protein
MRFAEQDSSIKGELNEEYVELAAPSTTVCLKLDEPEVADRISKWIGEQEI